MGTPIHGGLGALQCWALASSIWAEVSHVVVTGMALSPGPCLPLVLQAEWEQALVIGEWPLDVPLGALLPGRGIPSPPSPFLVGDMRPCF